MYIWGTLCGQIKVQSVQISALFARFPCRGSLLKLSVNCQATHYFFNYNNTSLCYFIRKHSTELHTSGRAVRDTDT